MTAVKFKEYSLWCVYKITKIRYTLKQSIADFFDKFMESIFQEYLERSIKTYLRGDSGFSSQNFMKPVRVMAVSY